MDTTSDVKPQTGKKAGSLRLALRVISLLFILGAFLLTWREWQNFRTAVSAFPAGSTAGDIPVGGLTRTEAAERLQTAYGSPVLLRYGDAEILLHPEAAGFELDIEAMLPEHTGTAIEAFRDHLWGRTPEPFNTPLAASHSRDQLRAFLEDLALRYDLPATAPRPIPATPRFQAGEMGRRLEVEAALHPIEAAFYSLEERRVDLPLVTETPPEASFQNLEILLQQNISASGFDGLVGLYLHDLQQDRTIHFVFRDGEELPVEPDVAFTASSIIKIPILISVFRRLDAPPTPQQDEWIREMIANSSNPAADALMKWTLDEVRGPLIVSEDLQALGLENSFLAGYFEPGAPLLQLFETAANRRSDVDTQPDLYNQTTSGEIGRLLTAIERCGRSQNSMLVQVFSGEITPEECRTITEYLKLDRQAYLISAGLADGTPIAHKHGYGSTSAGVITTIGDAGIVYSPGGDYVLVIFLNNPELLLWDPANSLAARLSEAVFNFFNLPAPIPAEG